MAGERSLKNTYTNSTIASNRCSSIYMYVQFGVQNSSFNKLKIENWKDNFDNGELYHTTQVINTDIKDCYTDYGGDADPIHVPIEWV